MPPRALEQVALRYYDLFNSRDFEAAERLVSPQAVFHYPHTKEHLIGRAGYRELARTWVVAFPDAQVQIREMAVDGRHRVRIALLGSGTHTGPLGFGGQLSLEPSGRRVELALTDTLEIVDGLVVNSWLAFDVADLVRRLTGYRGEGAAPGAS